jgi:hypothetical protein
MAKTVSLDLDNSKIGVSIFTDVKGILMVRANYVIENLQDPDAHAHSAPAEMTLTEDDFDSEEWGAIASAISVIRSKVRAVEGV